MAAVGQDGALLLREGGHHGEAALGKFLLKLPQGLLDELHHAQPVQVHRQTSGGRLGRLHQILRQLLEALALAVQHLDIFLGLGIVDVLLFQQIHIVDDAGQRGLEIVGDVGDQLGLEALALDALVHGISDGGAQIVELPGVPGQVTVHFVGVDLEVRVAPHDAAGALPHPLPLDGPAAKAVEHKALKHGDEEDGQRGEQGAGQVEQKEHHHPARHGPAPGRRPAAPGDQLAQHIDEGIAPQGAGLDAGGHGKAEGQDTAQNGYGDDTHADQQVGGQLGYVEAEGDRVPRVEKESDGPKRAEGQQIQRDAVEPVAPRAALLLPPAGGPEQKHQQEYPCDVQHQGQHRQGGEVAGVLLVVLVTVPELVLDGERVGCAVFQGQHGGGHPAVHLLVIVPGIAVKGVAVLGGEPGILRGDELLGASGVGKGDIEEVVLLLPVPDHIILLAGGPVLGEGELLLLHGVNALVQGGRPLQVGVDEGAGVVAPDGKAEVGPLRGEGLLQHVQPPLIQVGQGAVPLLVLEQPGQLVHLTGAVIQVGVIVVAVVIPAAQPQGIPLVEDKDSGPEAAGAHGQGQKDGGRLGRQTGSESFHGITSWNMGGVRPERAPPRPFPSCTPAPRPP